MINFRTKNFIIFLATIVFFAVNAEFVFAQSILFDKNIDLQGVKSILNANSIGIGTTSPISKLSIGDVSKNINTSGLTLGAGQSAIEFIASTYSSGYGHRIYSYDLADGSGIVDLRIAGRQGSTNWTDLATIKSNGNVGIGTTNPGYKLDVQGTGQFTQPVIVGTPVSASHAATKSYVDSMFSGSGQWTTSGNNIYFSLSGNVGIGTTSPGYKLDVAGTARFGQTYFSNSDIYFTDTAHSHTGIGNTTGYAAIENASDFNTLMILGRSGGIGGVRSVSVWDRLDVNGNFNASGNVGIGTTSPGAKLDVNGAVSSKNLASSNLLESSTHLGDSGVWGSVATVVTTFTDGSQIKALESTSDGNGSNCYQWAVYQKFVKVDPNKKYEFSVWMRQIVGTSGSKYLGFYVYDSNANFIGGAWGNPYFWATNTTSGDWRKVNGFLDPSYVTDANNDGMSDIQSSKTIGVDWRMPSNAAYAKIRFGYCYSNVAGDKVQFAYPEIREVSPDDNEYGTVYVNNWNGNVGIGTTAPAYKLDVSGTGQFTQPVIVGTPVSASHAATKSYVDSMFSGSGQWTTSGNNIYFSLSGNVGIGTTAPASKLDVVGTFYTRLYVKGNCSGAVTIDWDQGNTQHCVLTGNTTFTFVNGRSGANYRLILKQDGTGSRTVVWPASVRWGSGGLPTLTTTPNRSDYVAFIYNGVDGSYDGVAFNSGF